MSGAVKEKAGESRVVLPAVSWSLYQSIAESRGDRPLPRLTYSDGVLELMSPSYLHEILTRRISMFVLMLARGLRLPCLDAGSTRWESAGLGKGKEPDACFYLAGEPSVRGLKDIDLSIHPPPDLAVEVELSHPLGDALSVYAALGVPEVWRFDGDSLGFFHLENESYVERETSLNFPALRSVEAFDWLSRAESAEQAAWSVEVEEWARRELAARVG